MFIIFKYGSVFNLHGWQGVWVYSSLFAFCHRNVTKNLSSDLNVWSWCKCLLLQSNTCQRLYGVWIWRWFSTLIDHTRSPCRPRKVITLSYINIIYNVCQFFLGPQSQIWGGEPWVSQTYTSKSLIHLFGHSVTIIVVVGSLSLISTWEM